MELKYGRIIRKALKIFWLTLVAVVAVLFAGTLAVQFPKVQTAIADRVVGILSEKLDGDIRFEKIHFKPFTTLVIKNAVITDREPASDPRGVFTEPVDTFFRAEYIIASFTLDGLFKQEGIHLRKAFIDNAQMNLVLENKEDSGDGDITTDNLSRIFRLKKADPDKPKNMKELFHIKKVEIRDMGFHMISCQADRPEYDYEHGIDWNDLDVKNIDIQARELIFKEGKMSGKADRISFREKSGYTCSEISGETIVGGGKTIVEDLRIIDRWSDVNLPMFTMSYRNAKSFSDFINKVRIDATIGPSSVDFTTISYFAPSLEGNCLKASVSGEVSGFVSGFTMNDIRIASEDGGFSGTVSGRMTGLPYIDRTVINAKASDFSLTTEGLGKFITQWMDEGELDLSRYAKGTVFKMDASVDGPMNGMHIDAGLNSTKGKLHADLILKDAVSDTEPINITGRAQTDNLDLGSIIGTSLVGETTLRTGIKAQIGRNNIRSYVRIDSVLVDKLHLNGYDYTGIAGAGTLAEEAFNGTIIANDPSLNFMFQGAFALSPKTQNSRYDFYAVVGHADLNAMNLDKRGVSEIEFQTKADFTRTRSGDIFGKIDIADLIGWNDQGRHEIGNINLTSHSTDNEFRARLNSKFADASFRGTATISEFIKDLKNVTLKEEMPALFRDPSYKWSGNDYNVSLKFHDSMNLLSFAIPGFYIADSTSFHADIDRNGILSAGLKSSRIAFKEQYMKGLEMSVSNRDSKLSGGLTCKEIMAASLSLKDNSFEILAEDNHLGAGYKYANQDELVNKGEFIAVGDLDRTDAGKVSLGINILPSMLHLNSKEWNILPSRVQICDGEIDVESVGFSCGDQNIKLSGKTSTDQKDTLTLSLDRFDISMLNHILKSDLRVKGAVTGKVQLTSPLSSKGLLADLICDSTHIADVPLGVLTVGSSWDEDFERFNIALRNDLGGKSNIDLRGKLTPKLKTVEADILLDRLNVGYVQPVLTDVFSEMDGYISGKIAIDGPWNNFSISSENTRLDDAVLKVAYTNVPYNAEGTFHIDDKGVYFDDIMLTDSGNGTGSVSGSIDFDHFRDIRFNTRIKVNDIEGINLNESQADAFYGNLSATGNISITGPVNSLLMSIDAVTSGAGQLHIPLTNLSSGATATNLLKFTEKKTYVYIDPYETLINRLKTKEASESDFTVKLKVNASPQVEAFIEIDKASGNVLSGQGSGTIDLEVGKDLFNINGDYTLSGGKYKFVAAGITSRDFEIQDGSSIRFNGDIMESTLDIDAIYKTKTSLSTLISDTTSVSNRRTVDCGIHITEKLSNPRLDFSIEIPDLAPTIKSRVESALSTDDKVQKQFLSLIITNNFLPDEQSGISNNSSMLYSSVTEIMANQLNTIFEKLDIPLDLGMKYQTNEKGNDIFDVAVSTQLFNNRVVVNGNIGNKQHTTSGSQNDVVGDLDIEIKIDRSGAFRLNIFSHSADQYTNFIDNSQRNGVGLTYQTEFNNFGKFLKNIFSSRKKRREAKLAEEQAIIEEGRNIINIPEESDDNDR